MFAFSGCRSLSEIAPPPNLTEIGGCAFHECRSLSEITLPPNLTKVGVSAFSGCRSSSEIALPPKLIEIGDSAFGGCTPLTEITLPAGPVDVGDDAFRECPGTRAPSSDVGVQERAWLFVLVAVVELTPFRPPSPTIHIPALSGPSAPAGSTTGVGPATLITITPHSPPKQTVCTHSAKLRPRVEDSLCLFVEWRSYWVQCGRTPTPSIHPQ